MVGDCNVYVIEEIESVLLVEFSLKDIKMLLNTPKAGGGDSNRHSQSCWPYQNYVMNKGTDPDTLKNC